MSEELFNVVEFLDDGTHKYVARGLTAEEAVRRARVSTRKPAAQFGVIIEVMITDSGDSCVFQWKYNQGVVWPLRTGAET